MMYIYYCRITDFYDLLRLSATRPLEGDRPAKREKTAAARFSAFSERRSGKETGTAELKEGRNASGVFSAPRIMSSGGPVVRQVYRTNCQKINKKNGEPVFFYGKKMKLFS